MSPFFKTVISPIIVAVVVIAAQFVIQPLMQRNIIAQTELWLQKKQVYIETIELIDKRFDSMEFKNSKPMRNLPTTDEINNVYRQLLFFCDNSEILTDFRNFMDLSVEGYCSPANRGKFIKLLREDLGKSKLSIADEEIPYFREHSRK
jgi:hypothetical protein